MATIDNNKNKMDRKIKVLRDQIDSLKKRLDETNPFSSPGEAKEIKKCRDQIERKNRKLTRLQDKHGGEDG